MASETSVRTIGTADGRFDHLRCGTCGTPHECHTADCPRHPFRPAWAKWLEQHPNPRSLGETDARVIEQWQEWARVAEVPGHVVEGEFPRVGVEATR